MVSEEEIRLSGNVPSEPENPNQEKEWRNGAKEGESPAQENGQNEDPVQPQDNPADTPEEGAQPSQNGGNSGQMSSGGGSSGAGNGQEGADPVEEAPVDGEEAPKQDAEELPQRIIEKKDEQGESGTQQPWGIQLDASSPWLWGGIALAVVLVGCVAADYFRRKARKKKRKAARAAAAAAYVSGGSVEVADYQDIGAREDQQDSHEYSHPDLYAQQGLMAVVADGMGGLANGKAVSSALVRTFIDGFPQVSGYYNQTADILLDLSIRANARVNQMLRGADRSGSTLVAALIRGGYLHFLTVGDSRIYLYRGGALLQLNREHIYQEELAVKAVNQGVSMAQVRGDRQAHSLTSYFGIGRIPCIDRNDEGIRLVPGDRILLASDGVFGTLSQDQMEQAMTLDVQAAADRMGQMIRTEDKPYQDNNTLIIVEYKG